MTYAAQNPYQNPYLVAQMRRRRPGPQGVPPPMPVSNRGPNNQLSIGNASGQISSTTGPGPQQPQQQEQSPLSDGLGLFNTAQRVGNLNLFGVAPDALAEGLTLNQGGPVEGALSAFGGEGPMVNGGSLFSGSLPANHAVGMSGGLGLGAAGLEAGFGTGAAAAGPSMFGPGLSGAAAGGVAPLAPAGAAAGGALSAVPFLGAAYMGLNALGIKNEQGDNPMFSGAGIMGFGPQGSIFNTLFDPDNLLGSVLGLDFF